MKKFLAVLTALAVLTSLTACSGKVLLTIAKLQIIRKTATYYCTKISTLTSIS